VAAIAQRITAADVVETRFMTGCAHSGAVARHRPQ
jgi:hypothetical protein